MRAVTIEQAKAELDELVDAALGGEPIALLRGRKRVAAIVSLSVGPAGLTDAQARRLLRQIEAQRQAGALRSFETADAAVAYLKRQVRRRARPRRSPER